MLHKRSPCYVTDSDFHPSWSLCKQTSNMNGWRELEPTFLDGALIVHKNIGCKCLLCLHMFLSPSSMNNSDLTRLRCLTSCWIDTHTNGFRFYGIKLWCYEASFFFGKCIHFLFCNDCVWQKVLVTWLCNQPKCIHRIVLRLSCVNVEFSLYPLHDHMVYLIVMLCPILFNVIRWGCQGMADENEFWPNYYNMVYQIATYCINI